MCNHSGVPDAEARKIWQHIGHLVLNAISPVSELLMTGLEKEGAVRAFGCSDQIDATVTINKPNKSDCADYGCSRAALQVRLVKCVTSDGLFG